MTDKTIPDRKSRIAMSLLDAVRAVDSTAKSADTLLTLARGIALRCQNARMSPAAFDNPAGRDALIAIAITMSVRELQQLSWNNAMALSKRWGEIVYTFGLDLPFDSGVRIDRVRKAAGVAQPYTTTNAYSAPKIWRTS